MFKFFATILTTLFVMQAGSAHAADAAAGKAKYDTNCAMCHGNTGKSDAPAAAALNPKPAVLAGYTDFARAKKAIKEGGPAVGKSPLMRGFAGTLSDADIDNIIEHIKTFK